MVNMWSKYFLLHLLLFSPPDICGPGQELSTGGTVTADCNVCPVGKYKNSSMLVCESCENGFTTETTGSTSSTDCIRMYKKHAKILTYLLSY